MIEIDGGAKSGSGTIVRVAVSLCTILGQEVRLTNIRAKRDRRGLRPQHQQVVAACAELCGGEVEGAEVGSSEIVYRPGRRIKGGAYEWDIGTAGSTTMLAMSLLLVGSFADRPSAFTLRGGLFQDFAPSAHYLQNVLVPLLRRMGLDAEVVVRRPGYVPEGQGVLELSVGPARSGLKSLVLTEQGRVVSIRGVALSSHLAEQEVSDRMADECAARLEEAGYEAEIDAVYESAAGQKGADLTVWAQTTSGAVFGADRAGKLGRRSEEIGRYVAESILEDLETGATVDRHLADQLIPFCAIADGVSEYVIPSVNEHVETNLWLVEKVLRARTTIDGRHLRIEGVGCRLRG
ncbi:MAG: RNA 3'-terminal phosphate cyclase [Dehalococcoidia bacterium]|nr:RNA 3'-terminal phosphate cyclase [Dehalococcoidia bacterium]